MTLEKTVAIIASFIILATSGDLFADQKSAPTERPVIERDGEQKKEKKVETIVYVTDLHCKHCAKRLARKLFAVPGVTKVRANVKQDMAIVMPEKDKVICPLKLWQAAEAAKFKVAKIETPEEVFTKKPVHLAKDSNDETQPQRKSTASKNAAPKSKS